MTKKHTQLYNTGKVLEILNISRETLKYLFESRKLKKEEFQTLPNGHKIFTDKDLEKIREALFEHTHGRKHKKSD